MATYTPNLNLKKPTGNEHYDVTAEDNDAKDKIDNEIGLVKSQLAERATKGELQAVASGSPKDVYATLATLQTAYPTGNTNIYLVTADKNWYFWNGSAWTAGGIYQGEGIIDGYVSPVKTSFMNVETITPTWVTGYYMSYITSKSVKTSANHQISQPIKLKKGETIEVKSITASNQVILLGKLASGEADITKSDTIESVITMGNTTEVIAKYSAVKDVEYVAVSTLIANGATIKKYYNVEPIKQSDEIIPSWTSGAYVKVSTKAMVNLASYKYTDVSLKVGETLYVSEFETNTDIGVLSKLVDGYISQIIGTLTGYGTIEYTAIEPVETLRITARVAQGAIIYKKVTNEGVRKQVENILNMPIPVNNDDDLKHLVKNVLCIGDSLTKGAYYSDVAGYSGNGIVENFPYYLGKLTDWIVTNGGFSGYSALDWWTNKQASYDFTTFDVFTIWLGTNGGFTDTLTADTASGDYNTYANTNTGSLCKIIEKIKAMNPKAKIFLGNCYATSGINVAISNSVLSQIAVKFGITLIENNDGSLYPTALYHTIYNSALNVHFSKVGNLHLARHYLDEIIATIKSNEADYENLLL